MQRRSCIRVSWARLRSRFRRWLRLRRRCRCYSLNHVESCRIVKRRMIALDVTGEISCSAESAPADRTATGIDAQVRLLHMLHVRLAPLVHSAAHLTPKRPPFLQHSHSHTVSLDRSVYCWRSWTFVNIEGGSWSAIPQMLIQSSFFNTYIYLLKTR